MVIRELLQFRWHIINRIFFLAEGHKLVSDLAIPEDAEYDGKK